MHIVLQACSIVIRLRLSAKWANVNQKYAQELVWLHECGSVPCPLNQCHTLDGRDNVMEKISAMPIR
jgi:hypothetical protein